MFQHKNSIAKSFKNLNFELRFKGILQKVQRKNNNNVNDNRNMIKLRINTAIDCFYGNCRFIMIFAK